MQSLRTWASLAAALLIGLPAVADEKPGSVIGVVRFTGKVPPATKIATADGGTIIHNDLVVDIKTAGLRDVAAILESASPRLKTSGGKPVVVDQREMLFIPRVVAVQHGQPVRFDNSDTCNHSVMANSTVAANQLNLFVAPGKPYEHVFEPQKRPVMIGCSLHAWMRAWIYIVPHPWFAVTDELGKFRINDIPPGKYTLWLHHADSGRQERRVVEILPGKALAVSIEWDKIDMK